LFLTDSGHRSAGLGDDDLDRKLLSHLGSDPSTDAAAILVAHPIPVKGCRTVDADDVATGLDGQVVDERVADERRQFESQTTHYAVPDLGGKGHSISRWLRAYVGFRGSCVASLGSSAFANDLLEAGTVNHGTAFFAKQICGDRDLVSVFRGCSKVQCLHRLQQLFASAIALRIRGVRIEP
jgi:hypothetical protein